LDKDFLVDGDILLMDSAPIHAADGTWDLIFRLLDSKNVRLVWLPKYSPEFNPVELYWRYLKMHIRHLPTAQDFVHLQNLVVEITSQIPMDVIFGWVLEAIEKWRTI
jgi:transposase